MRLEAVRFSFEGASLVIAGQGMPSQTLGSGRTGPFWLVGRQSPKLERDSYQSRYDRRDIGNSFHLSSSSSVPGARARATTSLGPRRLVMLRFQRGTARGRRVHIFRLRGAIPGIPVLIVNHEAVGGVVIGRPVWGV